MVDQDGDFAKLLEAKLRTILASGLRGDEALNELDSFPDRELDPATAAAFRAYWEYEALVVMARYFVASLDYVLDRENDIKKQRRDDAVRIMAKGGSDSFIGDRDAVRKHLRDIRGYALTDGMRILMGH